MLPLIAITALSCDDGPVALEPAPQGSAIDSRILITPSEVLSPDARTLLLLCRTERIYPCVNYRIAYAVARRGARIEVSFQRIEIGSVCFTAIGPARCDIDLGALAPGTYSLTFHVGTGDATFDLLVDDDVYAATPAGGEGVQFSPSTLRRIPDGTVWGLIGMVGLIGGSYDALASAFLDSLAARGALSVTLEPGEYGEFTIDSVGAMHWPWIHGCHVAVPYVRHYEGPSDSLGAVVAYFGRTQSQWMSITLRTWRGQLYRSWVTNTTGMGAIP